MKTVAVIFLFLLAWVNQALAQPLWRTVGAGVDERVGSIIGDEEHGDLYIAGYFHHSGGQLVDQIARWDGQQWNPIGNGLGCFPGTGDFPSSFTRMGDDLLIAGMYARCDSFDLTNYFHRWDGVEWKKEGNADGPLRLVKVNDELFAVGGFNRMDSVPLYRIARWNGTDWEQFGDSTFLKEVYNTKALAYYKDQYYLAGNFNLWPEAYEIVKWDGTAWIVPDGGVKGDSWVDDLVVYDSLLWVAGQFLEEDGNAGRHIMTWDGENWANPFVGVHYPTQVRDIHVLDNVLYITGYHYVYSDGQWRGPRWHAKYDGVNFCSFGGDDAYSTSLGSLGNRLYSNMGNYPNYNPRGYIAEWVGGDSVDFCVRQVPLVGVTEEQVPQAFMLLSPNPAHGENCSLTINLLRASEPVIKLWDASGKLLKVQTHPKLSAGTHTLDVGIHGLSAGIYLVGFEDGRGSVQTARLVKQ